MIYAIKKDGESPEKLILRYKKMFFTSRTVNLLKGKRYAVKKMKKRKIRESAIARSHYRSLRNKVYF